MYECSAVRGILSVVPRVLCRVIEMGPNSPRMPRLMLGRGLEDQLLATVVGAEQPELEKTKNDLVQVRRLLIHEECERTKITYYLLIVERHGQHLGFVVSLDLDAPTLDRVLAQARSPLDEMRTGEIVAFQMIYPH